MVSILIRYFVLFAGLLAVTPATVVRAQSLTPVQTKAHWRALLGRMHVGMSRARVERVLGHGFAVDTAASPELSKRPGGAHTALYILDPGWCAAITFDWHGFDPDERRNPYSLLHLYDHRVIARLELLARDAAVNARLRQ